MAAAMPQVAIVATAVSRPAATKPATATRRLRFHQRTRRPQPTLIMLRACRAMRCNRCQHKLPRKRVHGAPATLSSATQSLTTLSLVTPIPTTPIPQTRAPTTRRCRLRCPLPRSRQLHPGRQLHPSRQLLRSCQLLHGLPLVRGQRLPRRHRFQQALDCPARPLSRLTHTQRAK